MDVKQHCSRGQVVTGRGRFRQRIGQQITHTKHRLGLIENLRFVFFEPKDLKEAKERMRTVAGDRIQPVFAEGFGKLLDLLLTSRIEGDHRIAEILACVIQAGKRFALA